MKRRTKHSVSLRLLSEEVLTVDVAEPIAHGGLTTGEISPKMPEIDMIPYKEARH